LQLLSRIPWRRWNRALHRDIGYLAVGMTILYAVSGLAVNHVADWNPNYRMVQEWRDVGPMPTDPPDEELARMLLERLKVSERPRASFQPDQDTLEVFMREGKYSVDLPTGRVLFEAVRPRPVLHAFNRLHINAPKQGWTYLADLYALGLLALAVTGLFVLRGKQGITGRGAWLTLVGCAIPGLYWAWWAFWR
jgi:uncharacterized protein